MKSSKQQKKQQKTPKKQQKKQNTMLQIVTKSSKLPMKMQKLMLAHFFSSICYGTSF
jgi:hypothetical protein